MAKNLQKVDKLCKNHSKTMCKFSEKICSNLFIQNFNVQNPTYSPTFPSLPTSFSTNHSYLFNTNLFHFST